MRNLRVCHLVGANPENGLNYANFDWLLQSAGPAFADGELLDLAKEENLSDVDVVGRVLHDTHPGHTVSAHLESLVGQSGWGTTVTNSAESLGLRDDHEQSTGAEQRPQAGRNVGCSELFAQDRADARGQSKRVSVQQPQSGDPMGPTDLSQGGDTGQ